MSFCPYCGGNLKEVDVGFQHSTIVKICSDCKKEAPEVTSNSKQASEKDYYESKYGIDDFPTLPKGFTSFIKHPFINTIENITNVGVHLDIRIGNTIGSATSQVFIPPYGKIGYPPDYAQYTKAILPGGIMVTYYDSN
jgi:hypothetical protein